jgi:hypothetical protein
MPRRALYGGHMIEGSPEPRFEESHCWGIQRPARSQRGRGSLALRCRAKPGVLPLALWAVGRPGR